MGQIHADLEKQGKPIGCIDYLLAAQAISRNLVMVTNNSSEFQRIAYLRLEDWAL